MYTNYDYVFISYQRQMSYLSHSCSQSQHTDTNLPRSKLSHANAQNPDIGIILITQPAFLIFHINKTLVIFLIKNQT